MAEDHSTTVIIIGGGPVGLAAAADLDSRGIRSVVIEQRKYLEAPNVKCNHVSARTMERFRPLGLAKKIRESGLPSDYPQDVSFKLTLTGPELTRIPIPSREKRFYSRFGPDTHWDTPEPPHRVNQKYMEPVMMEHVASLENVTLLTETIYLKFEQDENGVVVDVVAADGSNQRKVRGKFLIGADGARSLVRKQIGAKLSGDAVLSNVQSSYIRAKGLYELMDSREAWGYYTFNTRRNGHVYAIDGEELFLVHTYLTAYEAENRTVDRDWAIRSILGVDETFSYEIISKEDWVARRLIVDKFRDNRVFLAGDSCHLWIPYAGYGMNAGIADVLNLTWVLSAYIHGWGDEGMLQAYQLERRPITEQVSRFVKAHQKKITESDIPDNIEEDSPDATIQRDKLARKIFDLNVQQFAAEGLNFGYVYTESPIIVYDGDQAPTFDMGTYVPSTVPGCRAPHFWLSDDVSVYDELGPGYSIIALDDDRGIERFRNAATRIGIPLKTITVDKGLVPAEYTSKFTVVRSDQHVVWRGDASPHDTNAVIARLRGSIAA